MATKKKKKKDKIPSVPEAQMIDVGSLKEAEMKYEPLSNDQFVDLMDDLMREQQRWFPQVLGRQIEAQSALYRNMGMLAREQGPQFAQTAFDMMKAYMPQFQGTYEQLGADLRNQLAAGPAPEFMQTYAGLGKRVNEGLAQGYNLGDELSAEVEQGIRAAQTARGGASILGPAMTAEEAYGKGSAALNLYNQRLAQAQGYLQGKTPTDIRTQITGQMQNYLQGRNPADIMSQMAQSYMGSQYYPQSTYLDTSLGMQAANIQQQGMSSYNSTLNTALQDYNRNYISAFGANNEAQFNNYDRNFEQYLYGQVVQHGLYSMPQATGGGGGAMGLAGAGIGAVGAIAGGALAAF